MCLMPDVGSIRVSPSSKVVRESVIVIRPLGIGPGRSPASQTKAVHNAFTGVHRGQGMMSPMSLAGM